MEQSEYRDIDIKLINDLQEFIKAALDVLPKDARDGENRTYFEGNLEAIETAKKNVADNNEKMTYLYDACTKWATQLAFLLFRRNAFTPELEKTFRGFETPEESTALVKKYMEADEARRQHIVNLQMKYNEKDYGMQVFKGIIGGMSPEEAKHKIEEYKAKVEAAEKGQAPQA